MSIGRRDLGGYWKNYVKWVKSLNIKESSKAGMISAKRIHIDNCRENTDKLLAELERLTPGARSIREVPQYNARKKCLRYYIYFEENITRIIKLYENRKVKVV